ncbi:hypothetical protein C2845_PM05G01440 [Panicum miliaceum]|uniref:Uncharacterized protein n=1 Tax=Panicum miliaceum TaxID=4540 RepID=A0A3L6SYN2_PANMI|nr:hypothetical protein C2845_PM05G01440 [Panicum miliaceum]
MIESDRFVAAHNARARAAAAASPASIIFLHRYGDAPSVVSLESCSGDLPGAGRQSPPPSTSRVVCRKP